MIVCLDDDVDCVITTTSRYEMFLTHPPLPRFALILKPCPTVFNLMSSTRTFSTPPDISDRCKFRRSMGYLLSDSVSKYFCRASPPPSHSSPSRSLSQPSSPTEKYESTKSHLSKNLGQSRPCLASQTGFLWSTYEQQRWTSTSVDSPEWTISQSYVFD